MRPKGALSLARARSKFGGTSRAEAARLVAAGRVRVDGRVERDPARWVLPQHSEVRVAVTFSGHRLRVPEHP